PKEQNLESNANIQSYVNGVQMAIDQFKTDTGVLPIKNSEESTPIFEKYPINFEGLVPRYLSEIPENAFSKGGHHIYVLVDVETNPTVKLIELHVSKNVNSVQQKVNQYRLDHENKLPILEKVTEGVWKIDYKAMMSDVASARSPYSSQSLPLILTSEGKVLVDYSLDIYLKLNERKTNAEGDLRQILVSESFFVPVHSLPYKTVDGEPVFDLSPKSEK
ncbi:MAG: hypothetical protein WD907_06775, partial [Bacilli bacterium]